MPWTAADADTHVNGLSAKQARAWAAIANQALKKCQADGRSDCDASAIKQANAAAQRIKEAAVPLSEVGKEFSRSNTAAMGSAMDALRAAVSTLQSLLDRATAKDSAPATEALRILAEAEALLEAADLSFSDRERLLRDALRADAGGVNTYVYLRDCFDDFCVYSVETGLGESGLTLYKRSYSIVDGTVTLGDATKVQLVTTYVPVAESQPDAGLLGRIGGAITAAVESVLGRPREAGAADAEITGDLVPLVEKAVRRDGTVPLKLIQPGWGSSGYYDAKVLKRDGPKVFDAGTKMYWDHPTPTEESERPERSLRDLAAELVSPARWEDQGAAGPGLYADAKVFGGFKEAVEELAPHIGVSIRALGKAAAGEAEGRQGPVIESLVAAKSVDFVTAPGAGGQILSLFEAARSRSNPIPQGGDEVTTDEAQRLQEANTALGQQLEQTRQELARLQEAATLREARELAAATLATITGLPEPTTARLVASEGARPIVKDGALDREAFTARVKESAASELAYLQSVGGLGSVRGMGATQAQEQTAEQSAAALEDSFTRLGMSESAAKLAAAGRG